MPMNRIGELIKEERKRQGISQEELCGNLCETSTLSRIENGTSQPGHKLLKALLERLGCDTQKINYYASSHGQQMHKIEVEIRVRAMHGQPIDDLLAEYKKGMSSRKNGSWKLEQQFLLMMQAEQGFYTKAWELRQVEQILEQALHLTISDENIKNIKKQKLYTSNEIEIFKDLALVYARQGGYMKAIQKFCMLADYIEDGRLDADDIGRCYPKVIAGLAECMRRCAMDKEILDYTDRAIRYCHKYMSYDCAAELYFFRGTACANTGKPEEARQCFEHAVALYRLAEKKDVALEIEQEKKFIEE